MKNDLQSRMALLGLAAAFSKGTTMYEEDIRKPTISLPKEPPTPKGAKKYRFDKDGNFTTEEGMLKTDIVFTCIARSDKKAKEKFNKALKL